MTMTNEELRDRRLAVLEEHFASEVAQDFDTTLARLTAASVDAGLESLISSNAVPGRVRRCVLARAMMPAVFMRAEF